VRSGVRIEETRISQTGCLESVALLSYSRPRAAGPRKAPEAVTEHKTGYKTADTLQSKALICTRPAEVQRNGGAIQADISSARTAVLQFSFSDTLSVTGMEESAQQHKSL